MPEWLTESLTPDPGLQPLAVGTRLVFALVMGAAVSWVYRHTRLESDQTGTFPPTLVLLTILISVVTQVIGTNTARAFSLVGTLSIVRFRTVVRDTQDTAFVIFAVVIGMAVGAGQLWIAVVTIAIVALAASLMMSKRSQHVAELSAYRLKVRLGLGTDLDTALRPTLTEHLIEQRLVSIGTAKQGVAINTSYEVRFRKNSSPAALVKAVNKIEGVQSVDLTARGEEEDDD
ncbi:MAG: DUF4956 domain-containing protein [Acidobacteriota bacterium]